MEFIVPDSVKTDLTFGKNYANDSKQNYNPVSTLKEI